MISYDSEEEIIMSVVPPQTMREYCKRTNKGKVSREFIPKDPANFDIKNSVLSGLRDNPFDRNVVRYLLEHLTRFYETTSICKPTDFTEDRVKLRLLGFSLIVRDND